MKIEQRKANLEAAISQAIGYAVEITFRSAREFTLSADGRRDFSGVVAWLKSSGWSIANVSETYDEEIDFSCLYFTV